MQAARFPRHSCRVLSLKIEIPADSLLDKYSNASEELGSIVFVGFPARKGDQGRQISFPDGVVKIPQARKRPFRSELSLRNPNRWTRAAVSLRISKEKYLIRVVCPKDSELSAVA